MVLRDRLRILAELPPCPPLFAEKQWQMVWLYALGLRQPQIMDVLEIGKETMRTYRKEVQKLTGTKCICGVISHCHWQGWLPKPPDWLLPPKWDFTG